jgi:hypothetical protein
VLGRGPHLRRWDGLVTALVIVVYAAVVVWAATHHEPWRDEVVPLSMARHAQSLGELLDAIKFEGHPILWYLVLWAAAQLTDHVWVLKVASIASAVAAMFLLARGPLPWWLKGLFIFSFFPLYEYSVISRAYALEMLALFAFCTLYPHRRAHPVALAVTVAMLANAEGPGLVMAAAAVGMVVVEGVMTGEWRRVITDRRVAVASVICIAGFALAVTIGTPAEGHRSDDLDLLAPSSIAAAVPKAIVWPAGHAGMLTILPWPSLLVWAFIAYLVRRPPVLFFAAAALMLLEASANAVPGLGAPRHLGSVMLVVIAAIWLDVAGGAPELRLGPSVMRARRWLGGALAVAMAISLAHQVSRGVSRLAIDVRGDYSSSRRLSELLRHDPSLAGAVVMGEPDARVFSLPYYADNRIYVPREDAYRDWAIWTRHRLVSYDLGALLGAARRVRQQCACPVVVTLGWPLTQADDHTSYHGTPLEEHFTVSSEAREEFLTATRLLARLGPSITDEHYDVYVLQ